MPTSPPGQVPRVGLAPGKLLRRQVQPGWTLLNRALPGRDYPGRDRLGGVGLARNPPDRWKRSPWYQGPLGEVGPEPYWPAGRRWARGFSPAWIYLSRLPGVDPPGQAQSTAWLGWKKPPLSPGYGPELQLFRGRPVGSTFYQPGNPVGLPKGQFPRPMNADEGFPARQRTARPAGEDLLRPVQALLEGERLPRPVGQRLPESPALLPEPQLMLLPNPARREKQAADRSVRPGRL